MSKRVIKCQVLKILGKGTVNLVILLATTMVRLVVPKGEETKFLATYIDAKASSNSLPRSHKKELFQGEK